MTDEQPIRAGDRVVHLQIPGVCMVLARRGSFLEVESSRGLRKVVHEVSLRRVGAVAPTPAGA